MKENNYARQANILNTSVTHSAYGRTHAMMDRCGQHHLLLSSCYVTFWALLHSTKRNRQNVRTAASQRKMLANSFSAAPCGTGRHTSCSIFKSGHISKGIACELTGALGSKIQPNGDSNHHSFPRRRAFVNKSTFDPRSKIKPQSLKIANCMMVNEILWLQ